MKIGLNLIALCFLFANCSRTVSRHEQFSNVLCDFNGQDKIAFLETRLESEKRDPDWNNNYGTDYQISLKEVGFDGSNARTLVKINLNVSFSNTDRLQWTESGFYLFHSSNNRFYRIDTTSGAALDITPEDIGNEVLFVSFSSDGQRALFLDFSEQASYWQVHNFGNKQTTKIPVLSHPGSSAGFVYHAGQRKILLFNLSSWTDTVFDVILVPEGSEADTSILYQTRNVISINTSLDEAHAVVNKSDTIYLVSVDSLIGGSFGKAISSDFKQGQSSFRVSNSGNKVVWVRQEVGIYKANVNIEKALLVGDRTNQL